MQAASISLLANKVHEYEYIMILHTHQNIGIMQHNQGFQKSLSKKHSQNSARPDLVTRFN